MKIAIFIGIGSLVSFFIQFTFANDLLNIYKNTKEEYEKEINSSLNYALEKVASRHKTTPNIVEGILKGTVTGCTKTDLIKNKEKIPKEEFAKCYEILYKEVEKEQQNKLLKDIVDNTTKGLDIYADNDTENSSFDLIEDINNISKLLFKEELPSLKSWGKINMRQKKIKLDKNKSYNPDHILKQLNTLNHPQSNTANSSNQASNTSNPEQNNNTNQNNSAKQTSSGKTSNTKPTFTNPNFQIGNICSQTNNNQSTSGKTYCIYNSTGEDTKNQFPENFETFIGGGEKASFITFSSGDINWNPGSGNANNGSENQNNNSDSENKRCSIGNNKILAICVKLIPSGPRGPVGGTTFADSVEKIIDKIEDDLKDIRGHWIIPSGHGDEALDIDYKHIKLADIFSFNIVLTKKPVFKYADKDPNVKKTEKNPPSACENIPGNLANLYTMIGIKNCSSTDADKNKYLIDMDKTKKNIQKTSWTMIAGKIGTDNTSPYEGINKEENRYVDFLNLMIKGFKNLDGLLQSWQDASATLKAKSE